MSSFEHPLLGSLKALFQLKTLNCTFWIVFIILSLGVTAFGQCPAGLDGKKFKLRPSGAGSEMGVEACYQETTGGTKKCWNFMTITDQQSKQINQFHSGQARTAEAVDLATAAVPGGKAATEGLKWAVAIIKKIAIAGAKEIGTRSAQAAVRPIEGLNSQNFFERTYTCSEARVAFGAYFKQVFPSGSKVSSPTYQTYDPAGHMVQTAEVGAASSTAH